MRRLLLIVALLAVPSWGSIAKVTGTGTPHTTNTSSSSTSCVITYTPHAAGDAIVLSLTAATTTISAVTPSDNGPGKGSTYIAIANQITSNEITYLWLTLSVDSGVTSFTVSWTTGSRNSCDLVEYSGVVGYGDWATNTGSTSPMNITMTTFFSNSWVVMAGGVRGTSTYSAGTACSPTSTCTLEDSVAGGGSTTTGDATSDDGNVASAGTSVTVQTMLSTAFAWTTVGVELTSVAPACIPGQIALLGAGCG